MKCDGCCENVSFISNLDLGQKKSDDDRNGEELDEEETVNTKQWKEGKCFKLNFLEKKGL